MTAPTKRGDFSDALAPDDTGRPEFAPAEQERSAIAQRRLADHRGLALDLQQLTYQPGILFGLGGPTEARGDTFAGWA